MKIVELVKKIFKENKQYEEITKSLLCLNDIIPMPKREDFINNQSELDLIDSYKDEYLKILKQNKTIISIDLMPEELHSFKNIYIDLLLNLCTEDNTDVSFELIEEYGNREVENLNIILTCIKLKIYRQEVASLEKTTRLRLIALNEIVESLLNGKLFTRIKTKELINSILYEISNLHGSLITFVNQQVAMKIESENYLKDISELPSYETSNNINEDLISKRLEELKYLMNKISPEELKN